jgi:hypothetical protein
MELYPIQSESEDYKNANLKKFMNYMLNTWIKSDDFINEWCVYNERHRTNNVLENWHSQLNKKVNKNYVTILKLLSVLEEEAKTHLIKTINIEKENTPNKRRMIEVEKYNFILKKTA